MLRSFVQVSFILFSFLTASVNVSRASEPSYPEEDTPFASRMQIRNYSKELIYMIELEHPTLGEKTLFLKPGDEKRIENFFPHESFRDRPHSYGLRVSCMIGEELFTETRTHIELFTLIALFDPKPYNVDSDCCFYTNLRLGTSSYLLPSSLKVDHFTAYKTLSQVQGSFPYFKVNFNPVSLSQSKTITPALKYWLDVARMIFESHFEINSQRVNGHLNSNKKALLDMFFCVHDGLIPNGYVRLEQEKSYLRMLTETPAIEGNTAVRKP